MAARLAGQGSAQTHRGRSPMVLHQEEQSKSGNARRVDHSPGHQGVNAVPGARWEAPAGLLPARLPLFFHRSLVPQPTFSPGAPAAKPGVGEEAAEPCGTPGARTLLTLSWLWRLLDPSVSSC